MKDKIEMENNKRMIMEMKKKINSGSARDKWKK